MHKAKKTDDRTRGRIIVIHNQSVSREQTIAEVTSRLIRHYNPEKTYLIGSSARGTARIDSDLDFLVILPDGTPREKFIDGAVYQQLANISLSGDVVPMRSQTFLDRSNWIMSLPAIALREGRLLYDSTAVPA